MMSPSGSTRRGLSRLHDQADQSMLTLVFLEKGGQSAGGCSRVHSAAPAVLEKSIDGGVESFVFIEVALGFLVSIG